MKYLPPLRDKPVYFEEIEREIISHFRRVLYEPLVNEIGKSSETVLNSLDGLIQAIVVGKIQFFNGRFEGTFSAKTTLALKKLGAVFDRKTSTFRIKLADLPSDLKTAIAVSESRMQRMAERVDKKLSSLVPKEIAEKLSLNHVFDQTIYKINEDFDESVKSLSIPLRFTPDQAERIRKEYVENMRLYIQDFTEKEIRELRLKVGSQVTDGVRYQKLVKTITDSYGTTRNKAKFLARQEVNLLSTKIKQIRYTDAGVVEYKWKCVAGSKAHPVRPMHKLLDGKLCRWDNPPVTDKFGNRKHPGQDYGCRCTAIPVVRF